MFEVALLSFVLSCQPRKCTTAGESEIFSLSSVGEVISPLEKHSIDPEVSISETLEAALTKDLASIPEVSHVMTERVEDGNLLVWIAIDKADSYEVRSQVYDKELGLIDGFPEVNFDFNLVPAMDRNPRELATGAQIVYSRS